LPFSWQARQTVEKGRQILVYQAMPTSGEPIVLVGYVHGFPRHPAPGTVVEPLTSGYEVRASDHRPELLYALVSVEWATPVTTMNVDAGTSSTEYRRGGVLGAPDGWSWYLSPAEFDGAVGGFRLNSRGLARGYRDARLPAELVALGAPEVVPIHDFQV
jgi:hypothetical protein